MKYREAYFRQLKWAGKLCSHRYVVEYGSSVRAALLARMRNSLAAVNQKHNVQRKISKSSFETTILFQFS